jgi:hypothetical protein
MQRAGLVKSRKHVMPAGQLFPHSPQFSLLPMSASQPSAATPLQSRRLNEQVNPHRPLVHTAVA